MLFALLVLPLFGTARATYAERLNLTCPTGYTIDQPEIKKTKVWKKCHDTSGGLSECIVKGYRVDDVSKLLDREKELCSYVNSRDHIVHYTDTLARKEAGVLKDYQKGPQFSAYLDELKSAFVNMTVEEHSKEKVEKVERAHNVSMTHVHEDARAALMAVLEDMVLETERFLTKVKKKSYNVLLDYESLDLEQLFELPALHKNPTPKVPHWTTGSSESTTSRDYKLHKTYVPKWW